MLNLVEYKEPQRMSSLRLALRLQFKRKLVRQEDIMLLNNNDSQMFKIITQVECNYVAIT